jgi:hypothetical protein
MHAIAALLQPFPLLLYAPAATLGLDDARGSYLRACLQRLVVVAKAGDVQAVRPELCA